MVEARVQSNLLGKLVHHFVLNNFLLLDLLNGCDKASVPMPTQEYFSELSFAQCSTHLEAVDNFGASTRLVASDFLPLLQFYDFVEGPKYSFIVMFGTLVHD